MDNMIILFSFRDWCRNFLKMDDYEVADNRNNRQIELGVSTE